jgi:energy-coupling factor transport system ATP-binding protein
LRFIFVKNGEEELIKFNNVSHVYHNEREDDTVSLSKINIDIHNGDFIAVIGANGSGKSTFAKHINGLLLPSKGNVIVDGYDTKNKEEIWELRKKVGMVFQNPDNQLVATTIEDDIAFGMENIGIEACEMKQRVEWALQLVGMADLRNKEPHLLSGGQKQKVVIAGALAMQTSYLVLDEPTSMLDPKGRKEILNTIKKLNREERITIIYITHFMSEAAEFDKIIVLNKGEIALTGSPKSIFLHYNELNKLNLELPQITMLSRLLYESGLDISPNILNEEEMIEKLCSLI